MVDFKKMYEELKVEEGKLEAGGKSAGMVGTAVNVLRICWQCDCSDWREVEAAERKKKPAAKKKKTEGSPTSPSGVGS